MRGWGDPVVKEEKFFDSMFNLIIAFIIGYYIAKERYKTK